MEQVFGDGIYRTGDPLSEFVVAGKCKNAGCAGTKFYYNGKNGACRSTNAF